MRLALLLAAAGPAPVEDIERAAVTAARVEGIAIRGEERSLILRAGTGGEIAIFTLDDGDPRPFASIAGEGEGAPRALCAWRPPNEQILYVYLADDRGRIEQRLLLFDQQDGDAAPPVVASRVRTLFAPAPVAACAVDPARGQLYAAVEGEGIRRFDASPPDPGTMGLSLAELARRLTAMADPGALGGELVLTLEAAGGRLGPLAIEWDPGGETYLMIVAGRERADGSFAPPVFRLPDMDAVSAETLNGPRPSE